MSPGFWRGKGMVKDGEFSPWVRGGFARDVFSGSNGIF